MYKKASSELVVARRRGGSDNGREHVRVAAADRVQGPLVEDHGDDAIQCDVSKRGKNLGLYTSPFGVGSPSGQAVHCQGLDEAILVVAPGLGKPRWAFLLSLMPCFT